MEELASCLESLWVKTHFALQPFSAVTLCYQRKNYVEPCKKVSHLTCADYFHSGLRWEKWVRECCTSAGREGKRTVVAAWGCPMCYVREPNSH